MCLIAIATPMGGKDAIMTGRSGIFNAEVDEAFAAFITYSLLMLARKNADFIVFKHYLSSTLYIFGNGR